jgi:hypothetical protein
MSEYIELTLDLDNAPSITIPGPAADITITAQTPAVSVRAEAPAITVGVPGPAGASMSVVHHGTNGAMARPDAPWVLWLGTATPTNALAWDAWQSENI